MKRVIKYCFMAALGLLIPGIVLCVLGMVTGGVWSDAFSRNNLISGTKPMWGWDWHWGRSTAASVAVCSGWTSPWRWAAWS